MGCRFPENALRVQGEWTVGGWALYAVGKEFVLYSEVIYGPTILAACLPASGIWPHYVGPAFLIFLSVLF